MIAIPRKYIVDESNEKVAVQLDIDTFEKLEGLVLDYALGQIMDNDEEQECMEVDEAQSYYQKLTKNT